MKLGKKQLEIGRFGYTTSRSRKLERVCWFFTQFPNSIYFDLTSVDKSPSLSHYDYALLGHEMKVENWHFRKYLPYSRCASNSTSTAFTDASGVNRRPSLLQRRKARREEKQKTEKALHFRQILLWKHFLAPQPRCIFGCDGDADTDTILSRGEKLWGEILHIRLIIGE